MKHITFYLDFVSPYAWLAFERLPEALEGLSYSVAYQPVLLGALLQQHANPGPAGIVPKRAWTYRHVTWLGHAQGTPLQMPARHPFNPLPLLRQALVRTATPGSAPDRGEAVAIESPCRASVATAATWSGWGLDMSSLSRCGGA